MDTLEGTTGSSLVQPVRTAAPAAPAEAANHSRLVNFVGIGSGEEQIASIQGVGHEQAKTGFGKRAALDAGGRTITRRELAVRLEAEAEPVEGIGGAALGEEAQSGLEGAVDVGRARAAQGRQGHAGGFGVGPRFVTERAVGAVVPAAFLADTGEQEAAALVEAGPNSLGRVAPGFLIESQQRDGRRTHPGGGFRYPGPARKL